MVSVSAAKADSMVEMKICVYLLNTSVSGYLYIEHFERAENNFAR